MHLLRAGASGDDGGARKDWMIAVHLPVQTGRRLQASFQPPSFSACLSVCLTSALLSCPGLQVQAQAQGLCNITLAAGELFTDLDHRVAS